MSYRRALIVLLCAAATGFAADSVWTAPARPTVDDSITFHLFSLSVCCCAEYHNDKVLVNDTMITLSFAVNSEPCTRCNCFAAGDWHEFKTGPLAAGTYGIYTAQDYYCKPGDPCPMIGMPVIMVRVGEVTVYEDAPSYTMLSGRRHGFQPKDISIRFNARRAELTISFQKAMAASLKIYSASGREQTILAPHQHFAAGKHHFNLSDTPGAKGVCIVHVATQSPSSLSKAVVYEK
jgi:hypothetical protein